MTEWQSFRREVRAGSSQQDEELDFKSQKTEDGLVREARKRLAREIRFKTKLHSLTRKTLVNGTCLF